LGGRELGADELDQHLDCKPTRASLRLNQLSLAGRVLGRSDLEAIRSEPSRCRANITHLNRECRGEAACSHCS
jgi:hypothetical protein